MNNENEIIEGKFEELEKVQNDTIEKETTNEYRYKNTKKSKNKRKKPYKAILLCGVVGVGAFFAGQLTSQYEVNITVIEKGSDKIVSTNSKLNNEQVDDIESTELVFNNKDNKVDNKSNIDSNAIANASKSVVSISAKSVGGNFFSQVGESAGSGVIIAEDEDYIYMLTNNHVVNGASAFQVSLDDEVYVEAKVLGTEPKNDIAIIYAKKENFDEADVDYNIATIGNSDELELGHTVYAIGNSAGEGKSVTSGIIGALNKKVTFDDGSSMNFIQTDAAINPGNSGGALVDENGYLVGINTAKLVDSSIEGMGYSIPINVAIEIGEKLVTKPFMGIQGANITDIIDGDIKALGLPNGVYIDAVVVASSADEAGLKSGDIITKMDDVEIESFDDLGEFLETCEINDEVEVTVFRNGDLIKLNLVLGSRANYE